CQLSNGINSKMTHYGIFPLKSISGQTSQPHTPIFNLSIGTKTKNSSMNCSAPHCTNIVVCNK
ncbi:MAG: hypothetical protein ACI8RD_009376, partial [Bacillariaceae sp.]